MTDDAADPILRVDPVDGGLRVRGQVDLSNVEPFRKALVERLRPGHEFSLDLEGCTYMGSEGLGVLIEAVKMLDGGQLSIRSPQGLVERVLDLAGLSKLPNVVISA